MDLSNLNSQSVMMLTYFDVKLEQYLLHLLEIYSGLNDILLNVSCMYAQGIIGFPCNE